MKRFFIFICIALLLGLLSLMGSYYWLTTIYAATPAPLTQPQTVEISPGTSGKAIALQLAEMGVVRHPEAFRLLSVLKKQNTRFQAGEYAFTPGITPRGVMEKMVKGEVIRYYITIPEGKTSDEIVALLKVNPTLTGEVTGLPAEGSLLPETYDFTKGTARKAILERMAKAQQQAVAELWPQRQANLPFTTPQEALILASIVEKETGKPEERPRVAAAYINRLRQGMMLQADPTVAYGVYGGQYADKPLTLRDLKTDTPYNTYTRTGLPAGPICHPGKASIAAVLQPLVTKEIYFVATGDGGHRFAETLAEHNRNVAEYRKWKARSQEVTKSGN